MGVGACRLLHEFDSARRTTRALQTIPNTVRQRVVTSVFEPESARRTTRVLGTIPNRIRPSVFETESARRTTCANNFEETRAVSH